MAEPVLVGVAGNYFKEEDANWKMCFIWTDSLATPMVTLSGSGNVHPETIWAWPATMFTRQGIVIRLYVKYTNPGWGLTFSVLQPGARRYDPVPWNGVELADLSTVDTKALVIEPHHGK
jgi:hypothetical protein